MRGMSLLQSILKVLLSTTALAFALTVAVPHYHDGQAGHSHPVQTCKICKLQEDFSADFSTSTVFEDTQVFVEASAITSHEFRRSLFILSCGSPRAPPTLVLS